MKISPATIEEIKNYLKAKKNQPKQTNTTLQTRQQNKTVSQRNYFKPLRNITSKHYLNYFKKEQRKASTLFSWWLNNAQTSPSQASTTSSVQAGFRKGRGTREQISNIQWIIEKVKGFKKNIYFCFIDYAKAFDCVDHNKLWKILQEMGIPDDLTASGEIVYRSASNT